MKQQLAGRSFSLLSGFCPPAPTVFALKVVLVGLFRHLDQLPLARIPAKYAPPIPPFRVHP